MSKFSNENSVRALELGWGEKGIYVLMAPFHIQKVQSIIPKVAFVQNGRA